MRLRQIPVAAGAALLAVCLLGGPAGAADGEVILGSSSSHPEVITDPAGGDCISFTPFSGSAVDNLTNATVALYGPGGCEGDPIAGLGPGESRMISGSTELGALQAQR